MTSILLLLSSIWVWAAPLPKFKTLPKSKINCKLVAKDHFGYLQEIQIPNQLPGAELQNGIYCDTKILQGYVQFKAPDQEDWAFYIYADQHKYTYLSVEVRPLTQTNPVQTNIRVSHSACDLIKNKGEFVFVTGLKTKENKPFGITLSCE